MAYKHETEQEFMESIVKQINSGSKTQSQLSEIALPPNSNAVEENPRAELQRIKALIAQKEQELHHLQKQKVEIMRKITGRL